MDILMCPKATMYFGGNALSTTFVLIVFIFAAIFSFAFTPAFIDIFERSGRLVKNYRGDMIAQGIGVMFPILSLLWYSLYIVLVKNYSFDMLLIQLAIIVACFIGFIDDMLGTRDVLGLKGHFKSLLKGRLTTGALKAMIGLLVAFIISFSCTSRITEIIVNTLIIALFTNFFNLLDLRPGRAIKVYIIAFFAVLVSLILTHKAATIIPFIPLMGSVIGYMPYDLKAKSMMGDAGSNVLGMSTGILVVLSCTWYVQLAVLAFLIGIHIYTEKYSLTVLIKNNRFLNFLDNLGRS
jgi:UDP-N-acetylmuramyl pentapeptide phosphotransferase/UDP-N-acetylglucosamine-1-phosphate transferase